MAFLCGENRKHILDDHGNKINTLKIKKHKYINQFSISANVEIEKNIIIYNYKKKPTANKYIN